MLTNSNEIERQASEWLARLDGNDSADTRAAFETWRAADPRRNAAYARLEATWARLDRLQAVRPAAMDSIDSDLLAEATAEATAEPRAEPTAGQRKRRRWIPFAAAASLLILIGGWLTLQTLSPADHYVTGVGGFERIVLTDGSIVELNTDTEVQVNFAADHRRVELLRGEAHFSVARDPSRPFVVAAGGIAVRAVGTQFNVRRRDQAIDVLVTEGKVLVGSPARTDGSLLTAGQAVTVESGRKMEVMKRSPDETSRELAWQTGMLAFEGDALVDVAAEFNRYNARQLIVTDPALAGLKIGGYFKATNLDAFVGVLETNFGVRSTADGDLILLERTHTE